MLSYKRKPLIVGLGVVGRKKLERYSFHARVAPGTAEKLKEVAKALGYLYNDEGSTGQLLDAIASGDLLLIAANKLTKSG